jgi:hypothetical protein
MAGGAAPPAGFAGGWAAGGGFPAVAPEEEFPPADDCAAPEEERDGDADCVPALDCGVEDGVALGREFPAGGEFASEDGFSSADNLKFEISDFRSDRYFSEVAALMDAERECEPVFCCGAVGWVEAGCALVDGLVEDEDGG